ncbi:unnamed protein product [Prorocentrum cordatum]|uniref:Uncharacterized protein n=1 Tax=Prorocentrum cordatum TaxID=2364126 RepID=A0ABN9SXK0_9DINO|nr:unnamed protein product [Polarella glacialis]|mmetsp:Transcript_2936/g.7903  ORF Transcript_2936/g.7903 Transcript_2936/m.7903 type:complete len:212 (-) Transcript_2936:10-645(-)
MRAEGVASSAPRRFGPSPASVGGELGQEFDHGLPVRSSPTLKATLEVLVATSVIVCFYTLWFVAELLFSTKWRTPGSEYRVLWRGTTALVVDITLPACGYFGAMYSNRHLTCCFCGCSFLVSSIAVISICISLFSSLSSVDWSDRAEQNKRAVPAMILDMVAFWFGRNLYCRMSSERIVAASPGPLVGQVFQSQGRTQPVATAHGTVTTSN